MTSQQTDRHLGAGHADVPRRPTRHRTAPAPSRPTLPPPGRGHARTRATLAATDAGAALVAWLLAVTVPGGGDRWALLAAVGAAAVLATLAGTRMYRARNCTWQVVELRGVLRASVTSAAVVAVLGFDSLSSPLLTAAAGGLASLIGVGGGRTLFRRWLRRRRQEGRNLRRVVLLAVPSEARRIHGLLQDQLELGYEVVGVVGGGPDDDDPEAGLPWLAQLDGAVGAALAHGATGAIVSSAGLPPRGVDRAVKSLVDAGLHVQVSAGIGGIDNGRLVPTPVGHEAFFYLEPSGAKPHMLATKRVFDVVVTSAVALVAAPVLALTALAIWAWDRGPVLYRQERVGHGGTRFHVLKFRSMVVDADARLAELQADNERTGPLFKMHRDPRVTPVGRIIRALSVDELPQLWNVLRGDMSLIGPRPPLPSEAETFDEELWARFDMPPGITGLWQIEARANPSFAVYRRLDLFYVENWTLALDVSILLSTIPVLVEHAVDALRRAVPRRAEDPGSGDPVSAGTVSGDAVIELDVV